MFRTASSLDVHGKALSDTKLSEESFSIPPQAILAFSIFSLSIEANSLISTTEVGVRELGGPKYIRGSFRRTSGSDK